MKSRGIDIANNEEIIIGSEHNTLAIETINNIGANARVFVYGAALRVLGNVGEGAQIEFLSDFIGRDESTMTVRGDIEARASINNVFRLEVKGKIHDEVNIQAWSQVVVDDIGNKVKLHSRLGNIEAGNIGENCKIATDRGDSIKCKDVGARTKLRATYKIILTKADPTVVSDIRVRSKKITLNKYEQKEPITVASCWEKLKSFSLFSKNKKSDATPSSTQSERQEHQLRQ